MATSAQRERLRADIDADSTTFPDDEVDDIFEEAQESYSDSAAYTAYTRVIALRRLLASAAKRTSYVQNQSSENLSDVFKHLKQLLDLWQGELGGAVGGTIGAVKLGGTRRKFKTIREYPGA